MESIKKELQDIESLLDNEPRNATLWMEHGIGKHLLGNYQQAEDSFRKSLQIDAASHSCHYNLANTLAGQGKLPEAIHHYLEAIELKPDHIPSLNNLADTYEQNGEAGKSHEMFHYQVKVNPDDPLSHFNLGNSFLRKNRHIEAAGCYKKTIELDESFTDAFFNIAWILDQVEAQKEALEYAKQGLTLDPEHDELKRLVDRLT